MSKKQLPRTSAGLREALFDEIDDLRNGSGDNGKAITVANLAKQIVNVVKAEMECHRMIADGTVPVDSLNRPLKLGK